MRFLVLCLITTDKGKMEWRSITPQDRMAGLIEYTATGDDITTIIGRIVLWGTGRQQKF